MKKLTIAIDFDGVIVEHKFPKIGNLLPGADTRIRALVNQGHYIIIWTCREDHNAEEAKEFLKKHNIPYHNFNNNNPDHIAAYNNNSRKIFADIYIDDRDWSIVTFPKIGGINWDIIYWSIQRFINETTGED